MSFQFGTNWPGFVERAGNVAGPLLGYEVLTAFFMEATFLAIMLFGKERVSNGLHLTSTALVAIGTTLSAFWILSLNSWMQTPQGHEIVAGKFFVVDWWSVILNPSFPYRFAHMVTASLLTSSFLVAGVSAGRMIRRVDGPATALVLRTGVRAAAVLAPLQLVLGDLHGLNSFEHQPAKIAAVEAVWHTQRGAPLTLFGWPDEQQGLTRFAIEIPGGASLLLTHDPDGVVTGLDAFPAAHPPVAPVFVAFRLMVGLGFTMLAVAWYATWTTRAKRPPQRGVLRMLSWMTFSGWVATLAGWSVTEIGRQPWLIYGALRTADVVAPHPAATVGITLTAYAVLYAFLLLSYMLTLRYLGTKPAASLRMLNQPVPGAP
jgi:cytochrome d ubiquinol oxidase subunit I